MWDLRQAANRAFAPLDLSTFQVFVLNFVATNPQLHPGDIADRLWAQKSAVSSAVTKLMELGLMKRVKPLEDGRTRNLSLTEEGEEARLEANRLWKTATMTRYGAMTAKGKRTFLAGLKLIHSKRDSSPS